jgi:uncharacterized protein with GYD domain
MALYLHTASYTPESWAALLLAPEDRMKTGTEQALSATGGRLLAGGFMFGEFNIVAIFEAPDEASAAAFAAAVNAGGALKAERTQRLLSGEEMVEALRTASEVGRSYSPPSALAANAREAERFWDPR